MANKFAIVTGASTGIGFELAKLAGARRLRPAGRRRHAVSTPRRASSTRPTSRRSRSTCRPSRASTRCSTRPAGGRSTCSAPMPATASAAPSSIRMPPTGGTSSTPTSPARSICCRRCCRTMVARNDGKVLVTGSIAGYIPGSVPGGLQRHQGVRRQLHRGAPQRDQGRRRRHADHPDARAGRHRVLRARRHDGHHGRHRSEQEPTPPTSRRTAGTR